MSYPAEMIGRTEEWARLQEFCRRGDEEASLGIVWGRRRVGKSFLLQSLVEKTHGFYYEAIRGSRAEALRDLGAYIGQDSQAPAPPAFEDWDSAIGALMAMGRGRERVIVLDEYPYLLEHSPDLDSIIQRNFSPRSKSRTQSKARLILCGSALSVMSRLLSGTAPLRGRAGMDLRVSPFDLRGARELHGIDDLATALRTYAVIGGVAAYAREMTAGDLPSTSDDFDRWVCRRVLSPAAPLFSEIPFLLSEDPATAKARKINLYHAALAGIATGHHAHSKLTKYVKISGASLAPIIEALVSAELVARVDDPIRENRPTYYPADALIRFHYAIIRRYQTQLGRHGADKDAIWNHVRPTFESQVVGPCFEAAARYWTTHFADPETLGGHPDHIGPTVLTLADGSDCQLDVVAAAGDADTASERSIRALGEAKAGRHPSMRDLQRLESARASLGPRASTAKLLLFASGFAQEVHDEANRRDDVELIDLDRLYSGS